MWENQDPRFAKLAEFVDAYSKKVQPKSANLTFLDFSAFYTGNHLPFNSFNCSMVTWRSPKEEFSYEYQVYMKWEKNDWIGNENRVGIQSSVSLGRNLMNLT